MIRYTLQCAQGHSFESWFPSSSSYEEQRARGFVACPECGATDVEKAIMAPSVARTDKSVQTAPAPVVGEVDDPPAAVPQLAATSGPAKELQALMRQVREHVVKNADYVGDDFARLARRMHEGDEEHRAIYGEATSEEVKALHEDEVEVFPLPLLPEEQN
ncbi:DUF1178 family protein [Xanthobacter sp. TB0139]|uniref:DUF1178 family protein n=1 Tax=Xanthobacter sp. TB0139 TaxID=3459178 RepID=UPI004039FDBE